MEHEFEHLSDAQIENYGDRTGAGPNQLDNDQAVEAHLSSCDACCARLLAFHRSRFGLIQGATSPTRECPSQDSLRALAACLPTPANSAALMQHAAQCDHCGPILRAYTEDFSEELSPADEALLNQLNSASPSWQNKIVRKMTESVSAQPVSAASATTSPAVQQSTLKDDPVAQPGSAVSPVLAGRGGQPRSAVHLPTPRIGEASRFRLPSFKWLLVPVGAIACLLIAFFIWNAQRETPEKVEKLLAQAYTEQRTMEMRIPGADYAALAPIERGAPTTQPSELFEAKSRILRHLARTPDDSRWLRELGVQELIEGRFDEAIANLKHALVIDASSTSAMLDLAAAHFQRAQATSDSADYRQAVELLGKVLAAEPNNAVALFNRAVLYQEMSPPLYDLALDDWNRYLDLDTEGLWHDEAQRRKSVVEGLKKNASLSPQSFSDLPELQAGKEMDEEALEDALENWLPAAYELPIYRPTPHAAVSHERIATLSHLLWIRHHDSWLKDLLKSSQQEQFPSAAGLLARTIKENQSGHPDEALIAARRVQHLFASMHNSAGQRRADFEEIYALQRLANSRECLEHINRVQNVTSLSDFPWLKAQLLLEKSTCVGRRGDMDQAIHEAERGAQVARSAGFESLTLRALGMLSELKATVADDDASWRIAQGGLKQFWHGGFPAIRGYQFYGSLGYTAENAEQWQLATALNLQAVALATQANNKSIEAMARYRLAGDALMAGNNSLAAKQFEQAETLFAALPQAESWKIYQAYSQVVLAGLEAHRNKLDSSRELLQKSVPSMVNIDDFILQLSYYQTYGELQVKKGQPAAAEKSFLSALQICRAWLTGLRDESDRVAVERFAGDIYRDLVDIVSSKDFQPNEGLALWQEFRALTGPQLEKKQAFYTKAASSDSAQLTNSVREELRSLHDRTLLTFVQFQDGLGIWVGDDRGIFFQKVNLKPSELENKIRHFQALCSQRNSDLNEIHADGRELYNLLLAPVASRLDYRRVLLVDADESLKDLPFQAVVDRQDRYFGQTVTIIDSPGLSFETKMGHHHDSVLFRENATILAPTAPPNLGRDLLPLKDAILEAQSVASHFSRHTLLLREEATRDALRSALAKSATFHFAGHAVLNGDEVGLVLAGKGHSGTPEADFLSSENIKEEVLPDLRLVVLAACSTGVSGEGDLYGRRNLVQAFLQAGVEHVIATRWDVDSEATKSLMEQFYSALENGRSVSEALQYAQQRVLLNQSTAKPYYWAAFSLSGAS